MLFKLLKTIIFLVAPRYQKWVDFKYKTEGIIRKCYYEKILYSCGTNLIVNGKPLLFNLYNISLGNYVTINNGVQISPQQGKVFIDDYVVMSRGSQITAGELNTAKWINEGYKNSEHIVGNVHIGEGCWLCVNSIVLPGVNISGKGVIVAAGAVVVDDIKEDYVVVGGVPARIIKRLKNDK